eukprot:1342958-Amphidinium_carterae.1
MVLLSCLDLHLLPSCSIRLRRSLSTSKELCLSMYLKSGGQTVLSTPWHSPRWCQWWRPGCTG